MYEYAEGETYFGSNFFVEKLTIVGKSWASTLQIPKSLFLYNIAYFELNEFAQEFYHADTILPVFE